MGIPLKPATPPPHGTAVVTLAVRDGFIMAADGLTIFEAGDPSHPDLLVRANAVEPKIAVCGKIFLCGMAGINPFPTIDEPGVKIEYHFQHWISTIGSNQQASPRQFAKAIQCKARQTFRDMDTVLKTDKMWKSKLAPPELLIFQIAGFDRDTPQVCEVHLPIDRKNQQVLYPDPQCAVPEWKSSSPTSFIRYPISAHRNMDEAVKAGTPQARRFAELQPRAIATARTLLPDAPPAIQAIVGNAASFIQVEGEFDPEKVGGITTVGVIIKGKLPTVFQFPHH